MSNASEPLVKVSPFVAGAAASGHVIVRLVNEPRYLGLTTAERGVAEELANGDGVTLSELLPRFFAADGALDLKSGIGLILKLHRAGFIENTSDEMTARLNEFARGGHSSAEKLGAFTKILAVALDLELLRFDRVRVHMVARELGRALISWPVLIAMFAFVAALGIYSGVTLPAQSLLGTELLKPEHLVAKLFFTFSTAASWIAFLQMAALAGAGARFTRGSLRLTSFFVLRLVTHDDDAHMLPRLAMARYFALSVLAPWASALVFLQMATVAHESVFSLFAMAFSVIGFFSLCPLYRSPIVKLGEGVLATPGLLRAANSFLSNGLFSGLFHQKTSAENAGGTGENAARQWWLAGFASLSLGWLYVVSIVFLDASLAAMPDLAVMALDRRHPVAALASILLLVAMILALLIPAMKLISIPFQNLAALASMPLHRARKDLSAFYDKKIPATAALAAFLREIPIFIGMSDGEVAKLIASLKFRQYRPGQSVIRQGENGQEFFVLAEGQAQVILPGKEGHGETVADVLNPGDSFGEIALIENVTRRATIRALTTIKTLVLERKAFNEIFPPETEERARLTSVIRLVKLVLESEGLSHLSPRQVRELLARTSMATFADGEFLIKEDTDGDAAYLIESGEVQVVREVGSMEVANLGRGKLVGAISLIKDVKRTASCRAHGTVTALKIDKKTFLGMCLSNMFVALLVADLSDRQIAQTQKKAG